MLRMIKIGFYFFCLHLFSRIKDKINNPPKNYNDQEISSKFRAFIALKASAKSGKKMNSKF